MSNASIQLKTDWQKTHVELLKVLDGYRFSKANTDEGYVDYIAKNKNGDKKLLRVVVDENLIEDKATVVEIENILEEVKESDIGEATLMAERLTASSRRIALNEDSLSFITSSKKPIYSPTDIMFAIQSQVKEYCISKCGDVPKSEKDCPGYSEGESTCSARQISDDADFHAEMQWINLLIKDFSKLLELNN